jgi:hypothetical protein
MRFVPLVALFAAACGQGEDQAAPAKSEMRVARTAPAPSTASAQAPVVVELYQSQGCSSCPPANASVNALADRADVLALSFGVTYWDKLGWTDSFARPEYTGRQWDYARAAGRGSVATPQVVINGGTRTVVGANPAQLDAAIAAAGSPEGGPELEIAGDAVRIGAGEGGSSTVWLVRYDPGVRQVAIKAGENGGRTLPHRAVVRQLTRLGDWTGAPVRFALPPATEPGLSAAVLVQRGAGGPITAARRV